MRQRPEQIFFQTGRTLEVMNALARSDGLANAPEWAHALLNELIQKYKVEVRIALQSR